ncbi:MAG: ParB/RepB/Spo0J family partition protein, partial [Thermosulfidibacteraceae bacterium]
MKKLTTFEDPVKGYPLELKVMSIDEIRIPKFQRDLSKTLVNHLMVSIEKMGFLVPVIVCRAPDGYIYVVDGMHRIEALKALGYDKVLAIEVPEELYFQILDFNTEKPPTIRDKAKQAYRLYLSIIEDLGDEAGRAKEIEFSGKLQSPHFVTIGCLLEEVNPKFPAGYWDDLIEKVDNFLDLPMVDALEERKKRAIRL